MPNRGLGTYFVKNTKSIWYSREIVVPLQPETYKTPFSAQDRAEKGRKKSYHCKWKEPWCCSSRAL